jgi:hypothetical protein
MPNSHARARFFVLVLCVYVCARGKREREREREIKRKNYVMWFRVGKNERARHASTQIFFFFSLREQRPRPPTPAKPLRAVVSSCVFFFRDRFFMIDQKKRSKKIQKRGSSLSRIEGKNTKPTCAIPRANPRKRAKTQKETSATTTTTSRERPFC